MTEQKNQNQLRKSIVNQDNFLIKKRFSQNFLLDENIINKIVKSANIDSKTSVIEVGPGLGALTKEIITDVKELLVYEIDKDLVPYLQSFFSTYENFHLINQDILKVDINSDIKKYLGEAERIVVISNLPYHITTPIIMKFLEDVSDIDSMILMMQYEVAKRITSKPNTKDYNALSVIIQHQCQARYLFKVPKSVFKPQPNVDSAIIELEIKKDINNFEHRSFYSFVHNCFSQRRKTLINNLVSAYSKYTKAELDDILSKIGLKSTTRAESLSLDDFIELSKYYI